MVFVEKSFLLSKRETKAETKIFITKQLIMTAPSLVKTPDSINFGGQSTCWWWLLIPFDIKSKWLLWSRMFWRVRPLPLAAAAAAAAASAACSEEEALAPKGDPCPVRCCCLI